MEEIYALLSDIFLADFKKDGPMEISDDLLKSQFAEFMKDKMAPRILILNEINTAIQRLGLLLSQERFEGIDELLESMVKSIYFVAIASAREEMTKEQAQEFSRVHSKILDDYAALSINTLRTEMDFIEVDNYGTKNRKSFLGKFKWW
jgi:hypothetical protein